MNLPKIRKYKVAEIESIAADTLKKYLAPSHQPPIDIDLVAAQIGALIDCQKDLKKQLPVVGICWRRGSGKYSIIIDEDTMDYLPTICQFTIAEELGHIILHGDIIDEITTEEEAINLIESSDYSEMDRNAKRFAAAILMPPKWIEKKAEEIYPILIKTARFGDAEAIKDYMAQQMAKIFGVSELSMKFRLTEWPMNIYDRVEHAILNQEESLG